MKINSCIICDNRELLPKFQLTDYLLDNDQVQTSYVQCSNCGLIFQNPRIPQQEINKYYPPEYDSYQSENFDNPDFRSRLSQYGLSKRRKFVNNIKDGGKLLDVGSATGNFLREMQNSSGWDLFGVEINEHAAKTAQQQFSLNVFHGEINQANYPNNFFDIVTLWDVIEHLSDPQSVLLEVHRILKNDGVLIFRIPNGSSWDAKLFGKYWFGLDAPRHYYVFNQQTITKLLDLAGFRITNVECKIGSSIALPMNIRFLMSARKTPEHLRNLTMQVVTHPLIKMIVFPFTFLFDQLLLGSFLTVAAEKKEIDG
jgi:ubiquinone/menaquinone biosynthesis C-methylase UbiE